SSTIAGWGAAWPVSATAAATTRPVAAPTRAWTTPTSIDLAAPPAVTFPAVPFRTDEMSRELAALRERMNRLFDDSLAAGEEPAAWIPPADVYRAGDRLVITLELPGVDEYDVVLE